MNFVKHPVAVFPHQRDLTDRKRSRDQRQQVRCQCISDVCAKAGIDAAGQRKVKMKIVADIGVTPCRQVLFLALGQVGLPSAGQFSGRGRRTKVVQSFDDVLGNSVQRGGIAAWAQSQEAAMVLKRQPIKSERGDGPGQLGGGLFQLALHGAFGQPKRCFERAVNAVFTWGQRQLGHIKISDLRVNAFAARLIIPPQPRRTEVGERAGWWSIKNCVTFEHETLFAKVA